MCKVLENRSLQDEERMDQLTAQLKEARMLAEDADNKSDEVSRKLAFVEDELEVAEDRVKGGDAKIMELEEELKVKKTLKLKKKEADHPHLGLNLFLVAFARYSCVTFFSNVSSAIE